MKALVLEKRDGLAAVLREDGVYVTTAQPCEVGETIELNEKIVAFPRRKNRWMRSVVAAVLALILFTGSYSYMSVSACAYVSLDVGETSVEVSVNRLGRIISVQALNEDSAETARTMNGEMRGKKVDEAMDLAVGRFKEDGRFDEPDAFLIAGVTSDTDQRGEALTAAIENAANGAAPESLEFYTFEVSREERREAGEHDMSGGRFAFEQRGGERPDNPLPSEGVNSNRPTQPTQDAGTDIPQGDAPKHDSSGENIPSSEPAQQGEPIEPSTQVPAQSGELPIDTTGTPGGNHSEEEGEPPNNDAPTGTQEPGENAMPYEGGNPDGGAQEFPHQSDEPAPLSDSEQTLTGELNEGPLQNPNQSRALPTDAIGTPGGMPAEEMVELPNNLPTDPQKSEGNAVLSDSGFSDGVAVGFARQFENPAPPNKAESPNETWQGKDEQGEHTYPETAIGIIQTAQQNNNFPYTEAFATRPESNPLLQWK